MEKGWIVLNRSILNNWLWEDKPFSRGQAWIDILLHANHADAKVRLGNEFVDVKRGSFITSEYKLMDRWGWSKTKVRGFLSVLSTDEMITQKKDHKKTTIFVLKWDNFQCVENRKELVKDYKKTSKRLVKNLNNNENNENNENNRYKYIVEFLNKNTGKSYKYQSKSTQRLIDARLNEGYSEKDFEKVILHKCSEWIGDEKMSVYLRPETLFGTKFESYLNQAAPKKIDGDWGTSI